METDCVIYFTPKSTGQETATTNAHIFILTDLFLVAQHMTPKEREHAGPDGAEMWLSYPPLAGKHLRVTDVQGAPGGVSEYDSASTSMKLIQCYRTRPSSLDS